MEAEPLHELKQIISSRAAKEGGFREFLDEPPSTEATVWAILALMGDPSHAELIHKGRELLAAQQLADGRISLNGLREELFWPTPFAILAWHSDTAFSSHRERAVHFLLSHTGYHPKTRQSDIGHDPTILGWPWVEHTHSWIDPTSYAILALRSTGHSDHERVNEGIRLILDRQLPDGGWNYGNTRVFNNTLKPLPENTATALCALSGMVDASRISTSLSLLEREWHDVRTPWTLGWMALALSAWGRRPADTEQQLIACLENQNRLGPYKTSLLALLSVAHSRKQGTVTPGTTATP